MPMQRYSRFPTEAWAPLLAGLFWLWRAPGHGLVGFVFSVVPGTLLLGSGVAMLLISGDRRIAQFAALGGVLGVLFALPAFFVVGFFPGLFLVLASIVGFVGAGIHSVRLETDFDDVPAAVPGVALAAQVALDEAILGTMTATLPHTAPGEHPRIQAEIAQACELFESRGWFEKPADYHDLPPPLEDPSIRTATVRGTEYERLRFESGYEPHAEEPGRDRWLEQVANRTARAWVLRHREGNRPWLVCIHGFQMGIPRIDFLAFRPDWLHHRLGLNLLLPVLPLHGPRKAGRRSGDGFLTGDTLDTVHAEAQAMWDIRRLLSWVRGQGAPGVGVHGLSLGGYNTALLACLDADLACAIPGIPAADFTRLYFRHGPPLHLETAIAAGIEEVGMGKVLSVVSPLALEPQVPLERRYLFAGVGDRLVPPDQVRDLWLHWDRPRIVWYQGAHLTFRGHPAVRNLVEDGLRESGLTL